ncbi:VOC family protein [Sulfidibacter corallicola]|uniref:VOC family protein n=1 Tax=Sulfidibacter corallicola TaxID=2818388 RepID=A0A8A4TSM5_SULCO|nr:VOC family protein [Sulfidibacter corallicola]QTD52058.1 VOC family protein [Sulfidibacter corallicola]
MAIKGMKMIHIVSGDVNESRRFYGEILGLPEQSPMEGELAFGEEGHTQIWPVRLPEQEKAPKPGEVIMVLSSDDVRGDYARMTEAGVEFTIPPSNPYGPWEAHLRDPDGLWVTIIEV